MTRPSAAAFQLASAFDRQTLRRLAGRGSFARGEDYFAAGRVGSLDEKRGPAVVAQVRGTVSYAVKLWVEGDGLAYSCSCPRGDDGEFCKHCVAVGLAVLCGAVKPPKTRQPKPRVTLGDVRQYLAGQDKEDLVDLLMGRAEWDDTLREQLSLKAAKNRKRRGVDVEAMKEAIGAAIDPGDFLAWNQVGHAKGVEEVVNTIAEVLREGHAEEAVELTEHALQGVEASIGSVDDSDGYLGGILARLQELHHTACKKARPGAVKLARRLFARELSSGYDAFSGAVAKYAEILGPEGVAEYRRLAGERWSKVPAVGPGQQDPDGSRFRISSIMTTLARMDGDVEAQVEVRKKDLSHAYDFLKIAELYKDAGKHDLAHEWAERGLTAFPDRTDPRLREFLADECHRRGRHEDAIALVWAAFCERPRLEEYRNLKRHTDRAGDWTTWRERAWEVLRQAGGRRRGRRSTEGPRGDHSTLVEVLLSEGDAQAAWTEAQSAGCSETLWMVLAERREDEHPADALAVYQRHVELTLREAHNDAYAAAVKLLKRVRQVMAKTGKSELFSGYLGSVRAAHARKRNFLRLLDRAKWG